MGGSVSLGITRRTSPSLKRISLTHSLRLSMSWTDLDMTTPAPYLGCSTVMPARVSRLAGGAAGRASGGLGLPMARGNCGGVRRSGGGAGRDGGHLPRWERKR